MRCPTKRAFSPTKLPICTLGGHAPPEARACDGDWCCGQNPVGIAAEPFLVVQPAGRVTADEVTHLLLDLHLVTVVQAYRVLHQVIGELEMFLLSCNLAVVQLNKLHFHFGTQ